MKLLSNYPTEVLILLFLIITFLLSGLDKLINWKDNVSFTKEHFKSSPLKHQVPFLLMIILIIELIACFFMAIGEYNLFTNGSKEMALIGVELSAVTLLLLLIGQRLAKDYTGAMSLTVYFILTIFGVFLLSR